LLAAFEKACRIDGPHTGEPEVDDLIAGQAERELFAIRPLDDSIALKNARRPLYRLRENRWCKYVEDACRPFAVLLLGGHNEPRRRDIASKIGEILLYIAGKTAAESHDGVSWRYRKFWLNVRNYEQSPQFLSRTLPGSIRTSEIFERCFAIQSHGVLLNEG
jgi:hypothetical protein